MITANPRLGRDAGAGKSFSESWRFLAIATAVVVAWILFLLGETTAHVFSATRFVLYDQGSYLYAVEKWREGEVLYRDFAWQYGPLALGWYRAFAALGGNTPLTLVVASSVAFALAWILVARLMVGTGGWWGGVLAVVSLLPVMSQSGPVAMNGPHGAIEMLLFAVCATVLSSSGNSRWRPWLLGIVVGLLQWVRFGPHVVAFAGVLVIIAAEGRSNRPDGVSLLHSIWPFVWRLFAGYAVMWVPLARWFFAAVPNSAWEQLWPVHMVHHYAATYPNRWPQISSVREFFLIWLPALLGVAFALGQWIAAFRRREGKNERVDCPARGLMFLPLYYAIGCVVLFRNDYAVTGHLWLAAPGLGLAGLSRGWIRGVAALAIIPAIFGEIVRVRAVVNEDRTWNAQPLTLPNGQQLWFRANEAKRFDQLLHALSTPDSPSRSLAVFLGGGGIHYFYGTERVGRHWWFLPEFVRPWEESSVWEDILRSRRVLVVDMGQGDGVKAPGVVSVWLPLPQSIAVRLVPHLRNPRYLEGVGNLMEIVP